MGFSTETDYVLGSTKTGQAYELGVDRRDFFHHMVDCSVRHAAHRA